MYVHIFYLFFWIKLKMWIYLEKWKNNANILSRWHLFIIVCVILEKTMHVKLPASHLEWLYSKCECTHSHVKHNWSNATFTDKETMRPFLQGFSIYLLCTLIMLELPDNPDFNRLLQLSLGGVWRWLVCSMKCGYQVTT